MDKLFLHSPDELESIISRAVEHSMVARNSEKKPLIPHDLVSQKEAASFLRISLPTIIHWRKEKDLPHYDFNGRFFYSLSELLTYGRLRSQNNVNNSARK